jgi:hypothetical protein
MGRLRKLTTALRDPAEPGVRTATALALVSLAASIGFAAASDWWRSRASLGIAAAMAAVALLLGRSG